MIAFKCYETSVVILINEISKVSTLEMMGDVSVRSKRNTLNF